MAVRSPRSPRAPVAGPPSLRDRAHRRPAFGVVLVVSVVAIEAMAVATVMPTAVRSLHGLGSYGWTFTGFFLADIVGMVDAGRRCDLRGPRASLVGGLTLFAAGLIVAASATDMAMFLAGRVLQGLGAGSAVVAVYVVVARAFPSVLQPPAFAAISAAWVLPALIGPVAAGAVAAALGWRWVFAGIAPLSALGALLLVPVVRALPSVAPARAAAPRLGLLGGVLLAAGLGVLQSAGSHRNWVGALLLACGAALALTPLRRLLPAGSLRLARGLPAVITLRGVLTAAFFGAEAYLPLTLTRLHHGTPQVVGIPLTLGAIGWAAGSWWQGHRAKDEHRTELLTAGFVLLSGGVAALTVLASRSTPLWAAAPIWAIAGAGMGLAMPTLSVLTLKLSPAAQQGANSAALQVTDAIGGVLGIAAGASVIAGLATGSFASAIAIVDAGLAAVALGGAFASRRARPRAAAVAQAGATASAETTAA
jgi:MFS family permease